MEKSDGRLGPLYTHQQFLELLESENVDVDVLDPYSGMWQPNTFRCRKCGHVWTTIPHTVIYSRGCANCRRERVSAARNGQPEMTHDEFVAKVYETNRDLIVFGRFIDIDAFVPCGCARCGRTWMGNPRRMLAGIGCACPQYRVDPDTGHLLSVSGEDIGGFALEDDEWLSEFFPIPEDQLPPDEMDELFEAILGS